MNVDTSQLADLADDLGQAAAKVDDETRRVIFRAAMNVKRDWRSNVQADAGRLSRLAYAVGFEQTSDGTEATVEAKGGLGVFGAIREYGGAYSPPHNDAKRALDKEAPRLAKAIDALARKILK